MTSVFVTFLFNLNPPNPRIYLRDINFHNNNNKKILYFHFFLSILYLIFGIICLLCVFIVLFVFIFCVFYSFILFSFNWIQLSFSFSHLILCFIFILFFDWVLEFDAQTFVTLCYCHITSICICLYVCFKCVFYRFVCFFFF